MIAFSAVARLQSKNVYVMNDDGSGLHPVSISLTKPGAYPVFAHGPVWSPDGKSLLFALLGSQSPTNGLYIFNIDQGHAHKVATPFEFSYVLSWLADGRIICSSTSRTSGHMLYSIYLDGTHQQLLGKYGDYVEHVISPNGAYLARLKRRDSSISVQSLRDLQEYTLVDKSSGKREYIRWSPDGSKVAFKEVKSDALRERLFTVEMDGSSLREIGRIAFESNFAWAPDSARIAGMNPHLKAHERSFTLDVLTTEGSRQNTVCVVRKNPESGDFSPTAPAWSPDGSHLAYSSYGDQFETINIIGVGDKVPQCVVSEDEKLTSITSITWTRCDCIVAVVL